MDSHLRNVLEKLQRWTMKQLTDTLWTLWSWLGSCIAAICSDLFFPKAGPQKQISWFRRPDVWVKIVMSVVGLTLTCIGAWAAVSSVTEAKTANELAQWTSTKDFVEFCESHNFNASDCMSARNKTLPPPPGFSLLRWRSLSNSLWSFDSIPDDLQYHSVDITSIRFVMVVSICLFFLIRAALKRNTYDRFAFGMRRARRWLSRTSLGASHHATSLPLACPTVELTGNKDLVMQEVEPRHRKPTTRRRREARLDRFSRYRTTENSHTVDDDTSSDELYTHAEDTRRSRLRLRRRAKRVVNDENV